MGIDKERGLSTYPPILRYRGEKEKEKKGKRKKMMESNFKIVGVLGVIISIISIYTI